MNFVFQGRIDNYSPQTTPCYQYVTHHEENMADNCRGETTTRKRGRSKLLVRLFLLDPDKNVTKVTKEIGSKKGLSELEKKGCGPPSKGEYHWLIHKIFLYNLSMNRISAIKTAKHFEPAVQKD
jgi:hypothetical protein